MAKVIAIANQKGGVGKTSTTVNLGAGLVRQGYDVLLVDLDSQANLTMALGFQNPDDMVFTISNMMHKAVKEEQIDPTEGILTTSEGIDLMPSNVQLSGLELSLINEYGREVVLKQYIDEVRLNYDFILIDCAPSLSVLSVLRISAYRLYGWQTRYLGMRISERMNWITNFSAVMPWNRTNPAKAKGMATRMHSHPMISVPTNRRRPKYMPTADRMASMEQRSCRLLRPIRMDSSYSRISLTT